MNPTRNLLFRIPAFFFQSHHHSLHQIPHRHPSSLNSINTSSLPHLHSQLSLHSNSLNLIALLKTCTSIKQLCLPQLLQHPKPSSSSSYLTLLHQAYKSLLTLLGHYGLWTQINLTIKEIDQHPIILESLYTDPHFWFILVSAFIHSGKSPDPLLSHLAPIPLPLDLIKLLLHASILENNLAQSLSCLRHYILLTLPNSPNAGKPHDRTLLSKLASFFAQHGELGLAIDITNHYLVPIGQDESDLIENLVVIFRASIDRSNPDSTLYCYHHLYENHPSVLSSILNSEEGLSLSLLTLSYRHHLPSLSLKIISSLVQQQPQQTELKLVHLLPTLGTLCRSPKPPMNNIVDILIKMNCEGIVEEEQEWLEYHLVIGHLGGLTAYQETLLNSSASSSSSPTLTSTATSTSNSSFSLLEDSIIKLITENNNLFVKQESFRNQIVMTLLFNSLLQALMELGNRQRALKVYKKFFIRSDIDNDDNEEEEEEEGANDEVDDKADEKRRKRNGALVVPNSRTLKILGLKSESELLVE